MSFDHEIAELIQKYLKEVKSQELSIEEILSRPRWKRVWVWWTAREHYGIQDGKSMTMDECKSVYGD